MTARERFLRIEPRRADEEHESEAADRARIAAVIEAAPPSISGRPGTIDVAPEAPAGDGVPIPRAQEGQEIEDAPGAAAIEMAIDTEQVHGQPFVRCARCGADSTIHAAVCANCSAELDTAEQRAFNDKVWEAQTRRNQRERAALAEMAEARAEVIRTSVRALPEPGMKPPPELLDPIHDDGGPILFEAIKALQKPKWRWTAGALAAGLPFLLVTLGGPILSKIGWGLVLLLVLSLSPRKLAKRVFEVLLGARPRG